MNPIDKDSWQTPKWLFEQLNEIHKFELDAAASQDNHLCDSFFTITDDAMEQDWSKFKSVYCNPPYSAKKAGKSYGILGWCEKCCKESKKGCSIILLIPADTSTRYFKYCFHNAYEIMFLTPRIKFVGATNTPKFGSMVIWFNDGLRNINQQSIANIRLVKAGPDSLGLSHGRP